MTADPNQAPVSLPTALITGASYGIGRAVATALSRKGYGLILTARSADRLAAVGAELARSGGEVKVLPADIAQSSDRKRVLEHVAGLPSGLKALVHCAAAVPDPETESELSATTDERIDEIMATTVGAMHLLKGLQPALGRAKPSQGILFASDWALRGSHGPPVSSSAKATLLHFARTLRWECARLGCSLTTIIPGDVATYDADWNEPVWALDDSVAEVRRKLGETRIPLVDIVEAVVFVLDRRLARVDEIQLSPLAPEYDY